MNLFKKEPCHLDTDDNYEWTSTELSHRVFEMTSIEHLNIFNYSCITCSIELIGWTSTKLLHRVLKLTYPGYHFHRTIKYLPNYPYIDGEQTSTELLCWMFKLTYPGYHFNKTINYIIACNWIILVYRMNEIQQNFCIECSNRRI